MRILLVKMSSLGDVVHALPAVRDACLAGHSIDWVVEEAFADVARMAVGVQRVIPVAWRRWRKNLGTARTEMQQFYQDLRHQNYDLVLDTQGLLKSAVVGLLARGSRAGYSHTSAREPWSAFTYHARHRIPPGHAIDRQRQLFAQAIGYPIVADAADAGIPRPIQPTREIFLLHGTTWDSKHWPDTMWVALVKLLQAAGYSPVVTWGNDLEHERAQALFKAGALMHERSTLGVLARRLGSCAGVIGVDSGLTHLSAMLGIPTLGLYGPTDPVLTGCRGPRARALQGQAHCVPCMRQTCTRYRGAPLLWQNASVTPACFAALSPEVVWAQARELIGLTAEIEP